jgi:hypothetical protein
MELQEIPYITPIGLVFLIILSAFILMLPRKYVLIPLFAMTCYMTLGQSFDIAGLKFTLLRCLIFIGWVRIIARGEIFRGKLNVVDKMIIVWLIANITMFTIQNKNSAAFINRMGFAYNALGLYFFFRSTIVDFEDIQRTFRILALIALPLATAMIFERITMKNIFSAFGGVPSSIWTRGGTPRCQGPFRHPVLAGTYGATMIPYFAALWFSPERSKGIAIIGFIAATVITITSFSGGPAMSYLFAGITLAIWPLRNKMRSIRWGVFILILTLHIFMQAPVWYLMSKFGHLIGGTGWHRAYLVDQSLRYIKEWWLVGTNYTAHWMPYRLPSNPNMADITNQYLVEGVHGGLITMFLFIGIIVVCFKVIGKGMANTDDASHLKKVIWALGAALFVHAVTFMSVSYFDQIIVAWYLLLAMISVVLDTIVKSPVPVNAEIVTS